MSVSVNKVIIAGRVGAEPEKIATKSNQPMVKISVATEDAFREKDIWHKVIVWGSSATFTSAYVSKGDLVYVEGKLSKREYQNKKGDKVFATEIHSFKLLQLSRAKDAKSLSEHDKVPF